MVATLQVAKEILLLKNLAFILNDMIESDLDIVEKAFQSLWNFHLLPYIQRIERQRKEWWKGRKETRLSKVFVTSCSGEILRIMTEFLTLGSS